MPYEATWFILPDVPDFLVCTRCHQRYLREAPLSSTAFTKTKRVNGRCRFNVPRITRVLLPQCFQSNTLEPLKDYMRKRLELKDCKAHMYVKGSDEFTWFTIAAETNDIMINFISCQACFEDVILASTYAGEFMPRQDKHPDMAQTKDAAWLCDMGIAYNKRSFDVFQRNRVPFTDWVAKATERYRLPACEGKAVESASRTWVRPRDTVDNMVICQKCFYDNLAWTAIQDDFEYIPVPQSKTGSEWMDEALGYRTQPATSWVW